MRDVERVKDRQLDDLRQELRRAEKELTVSQRTVDRLETEANMMRMFYMRGAPMPSNTVHSTNPFTIFPEPRQAMQTSSQSSPKSPTKASTVRAGEAVELAFANGEKITLSPSKRTSYC